MKATGFKTFKRTVEMQDGVKLFLDKEMASRLLALLNTSQAPRTDLRNLNLLRSELERLKVQPTPNYGFKIVPR